MAHRAFCANVCVAPILPLFTMGAIVRKILKIKRWPTVLSVRVCVLLQYCHYLPWMPSFLRWLRPKDGPPCFLCSYDQKMAHLAFCASVCCSNITPPILPLFTMDAIVLKILKIKRWPTVLFVRVCVVPTLPLQYYRAFCARECVAQMLLLMPSRWFCWRSTRKYYHWCHRIKVKKITHRVCCSNITIDAIVLRLKRWPTVCVAQMLLKYYHWCHRIKVKKMAHRVCCSNITIDAIVLRLKRWPTVRVAQMQTISISISLLSKKSNQKHSNFFTLFTSHQ
jgi:hypothetical protein